jgi:cyclophilin family peptidyl-prolyl cis-trans isomerase
MAASLAPISALTVPSQQGYALPLNGSGTRDAQSFSVTSSDPDVGASIVHGPFWTITVSYTDPSNSANDFSGPMVFQLFQSTTVDGQNVPLATNAVKQIVQYTNDNYYTSPTTDGLSPTKLFTRIANLSNSSAASALIAQGGAPSSFGTGGTSGQPGTPFPNENFQQIAFTGVNQLALANAGANDNDTQFFITASSITPADSLNTGLGYDFTIFGQMVGGQSVLTKMFSVPLTGQQPTHHIAITGITLTSTNPNGVLLLDTTQARPGETTTIRVTATDPSDGSNVSRSFTVTVGHYPTPGPEFPPINDPAVNFRPFADPVTATGVPNQPTNISLNGQSGYPDARRPSLLSYTLVSPPSHGTVSQFDPTNGSLVYTPFRGFSGTDSFRYEVQATGPQATPVATTSNPATVTITIAPLVAVTGVQAVTNQKHRVTEILVHFSGAVDALQAQQTSIYDVVIAGSNRSFTAKNARTIKLTRAVYEAALDTVVLVPRNRFALTRRAELKVDGVPPSGLRDREGRLIDGDRDGKAGGNAIVIF